MIILAIDTTAPDVWLALARDGHRGFERTWRATPQLGRELLTTLHELLQTSNVPVATIDRIAVHAGPGHWGGIRAGVTMATMLALASNAKLVTLVSHNQDLALAAAATAQPVTAIVPQY